MTRTFEFIKLPILLLLLALTPSVASGFRLGSAFPGKKFSYSCTGETEKLELTLWKKVGNLYWFIQDQRGKKSMDINLHKKKYWQIYSPHQFTTIQFGNGITAEFKQQSSNFPDETGEFTPGTSYSATITPVDPAKFESWVKRNLTIKVNTLVSSEETYQSATYGSRKVHTFTESIKGPGKREITSTFKFDVIKQIVIYMKWEGKTVDGEKLDLTECNHINPLKS